MVVLYREINYILLFIWSFFRIWTTFKSATRLRCLYIPGRGLSSVARLRAIIQHKAKYLCCTPTYALYLAEVASEEDIDLSTSAVETIIVYITHRISEVISHSDRRGSDAHGDRPKSVRFLFCPLG